MLLVCCSLTNVKNCWQTNFYWPIFILYLDATMLSWVFSISVFLSFCFLLTVSFHWIFVLLPEIFHSLCIDSNRIKEKKHLKKTTTTTKEECHISKFLYVYLSGFGIRSKSKRCLIYWCISTLNVSFVHVILPLPLMWSYARKQWLTGSYQFYKRQCSCEHKHTKCTSFTQQMVKWKSEREREDLGRALARVTTFV